MENKYMVGFSDTNDECIITVYNKETNSSEYQSRENKETFMEEVERTSKFYNADMITETDLKNLEEYKFNSERKQVFEKYLGSFKGSTLLDEYMSEAIKSSIDRFELDLKLLEELINLKTPTKNRYGK